MYISVHICISLFITARRLDQDRCSKLNVGCKTHDSRAYAQKREKAPGDAKRRQETCARMGNGPEDTKTHK